MIRLNWDSLLQMLFVSDHLSLTKEKGFVIPGNISSLKLVKKLVRSRVKSWQISKIVIQDVSCVISVSVKKCMGHQACPDWLFFKSGRNIFAQVVNDDDESVTITGASTLSPEIRDERVSLNLNKRLH